ncbi:MAG: class I lanthipeptide [Candidatus Aminicenantes bacterium]|nr:MAG: class I lanthipeptide [Candidatus Aminicenantes bacterium]
MKAKKFSRKLKLNKKTIAHLDSEVMGKVYGGFYSRPTECVDTLIPHRCCIHQDPTF